MTVKFKTMKKDIHPTYYENAAIVCACGTRFKIGSTVQDIHVEICSQCHPFYTGKQKLVDTARRVDKFQKRVAKQAEVSKTRLGKKIKRARKEAKRETRSKKKTTINKKK